MVKCSWVEGEVPHPGNQRIADPQEDIDMLSMKERFGAKKFGYTRVVWARRANGVPFHQMFIKAEDAEKFAIGVKANGGHVTMIEEL